MIILQRFAIYERIPAHGNKENGSIMGPFNTREEAEEAQKRYGYCTDNYYVDFDDTNYQQSISINMGFPDAIFIDGLMIEESNVSDTLKYFRDKLQEHSRIPIDRFDVKNCEN
jgi:hypothetical protein